MVEIFASFIEGGCMSLIKKLKNLSLRARRRRAWQSRPLPFCHCEPAEGGRGNLVFPKKDWETYHLKNRLPRLTASAVRLAMTERVIPRNDSVVRLPRLNALAFRLAMTKMKKSLRSSQ